VRYASSLLKSKPDVQKAQQACFSDTLLSWNSGAGRIAVSDQSWIKASKENNNEYTG